MIHDGRRATQKDVARRAGVSQATVSTVLAGSGSHAIPETTSARVQQAVRDLGYVPNRSAQVLKTRRTMTLACVVPDIANPFYPPFLRGLQEVADEGNYDVISINTDGAADREARLLNWAMQGRIDGMAGVFFTLSAGAFKHLLDAGMAVVRVEAAAKNCGPLPIDNLYVDGVRASAEVVSFLLGRGHRSIAMISGIGGPQEHRVRGYRDMMGAAGEQPRIALDPSFNEDGGFRATRELLRDGPRPTAVVAVNDLMAIGSMAAIREAGLQVTGDVAVTGFDDIPAARLVTPALTTVAQFQDDLGRQAARILIERLDKGGAVGGTSREMPFRLIERQST